METSTFDPARSVVFDLNRGQVTLDGGGPLVLLPADVLTAVCGQLDVGVVRQLGAALGKQAGMRIRARLQRLGAPSLEVMVEQLGGELSLGGLGSLVLERWGQALVARIDGCPLSTHGPELLGGYVEGALLTSVDREVTALALEQTAQSVRLLLGGKAASARIKSSLQAGGSWGDALAALHRAQHEGGRV